MAAVDALQLGWRRPLPVVLQTEAAECGLACLAMVATYHGHAVDLATLRRRFAVSAHGATLATLVDFASRLGLASRAVRLEPADLGRLKLPCVLHWSFSHYVVLAKVRRRGVTIHDPGRGARVVSRAEVERAFTGVALELWPAATFEARVPEPAVRLRQLLGRVHGIPRALSQVLLLAAALETFALASPLFTQWIVDHALVTGSAELLAVLALGFGLLVIFEQATAALRSLVLMHFGTSLNVQWRANVFSHLMRLPLPYFEKRHLGDIVSRFGSVDAVQRTVTTAFVEALVDGVMALLLVAVLLWYNTTLAAICLAATGLYALGRWLAQRPLHAAALEQVAGAAKQDSHFLESVRGARAIKLFGRQAERRAAWLTLLVEQVNGGLRVQRLEIALRTANGALFGLENVLVIHTGATLVLGGALSTGMLLAFLAYKRLFATRVSALVDKSFEMRLLRLHGERLADIVLTEPEETCSEADRPDRGERERAASVELEGVRFRYGEHEAYLLDGVDLAVAPGECVAIVGASGAGKSTLLHVILGIVKPLAGEIRIAGRPLARLGGAERRRALVGVTQGDCLFAGSIADNISFFDPQAERGRIEECARLAAIDTEVAALPMGYDTPVGFLGSTLSAGQQQRLLLARALYAQPAVLVLDEATSHLDVRRERAVAHALQGLAMTRIVVAHRRETIATADRVVTLERGRLVEHAHVPGLRDDAGPPTGFRAGLGTVSREQQELLGNLGC
jgi:ATP-binding cassette subfamily B protein RaxB